MNQDTNRRTNMSNEYTTSTTKIALVTGGSRGIGRNTVVSLAKRGVHTIFTYHSHTTDAEAVVAAARDAGAQAICSSTLMFSSLS
jgi:NAD(P)-dependent dehydrogenase (short-subunit alcohol dehydrogenase family)